MQSYDHVSSAATDSAFTLAFELADSSSGLTPGSASAGLNIPSTKLRTLANLIASCVNSTGVTDACNQLFPLTAAGGTSVPTDTVGALLGIAKNPTQNVTALYNQTSPTSPFLPALTSAPADWTLPVTSTAPSLAITPAVLPATVMGVKYSAALQAQGGTPTYTWSLRSGNLPSGLSLAPTTGMITGVPTSSGTSAFTVQVADKSSPSQTAAAPLAITGSATPLTVSGSLPSATTGIAYAAGLTAGGGTPAYTWKLMNGSLPAGLTLAATTGVISGTPNTAGTSTFTLGATDNGSPVQTVTSTISMAIAAATPVATSGNTWYIRTDGGTRYSANVSQGQCDGLANVAYSGTGVNQHCAFNDFRYMWDDDSGIVHYPNGGEWVMAGGDTVIIQGCASGPNQVNGSSPNCRIGWDRPYGGTGNNWCYYVNGGSYACYNPPIPAGTAAHHTRILGQNYANCNNGGTDPKTYESNLAQIFGGFSVQYALNLDSTQYVDVQCMEITTHNGQCATTGSPAYPKACSTSPPLDDYGQNGIATNAATSNITLQDVYVHGFNSSGLQGPIGGPITMNRVSVGFNAFAGWNFDDGNDTPDASGSQILASYVTMIGNGCAEQYPLVNAFPALACHDSNSGGFGDAWSGQDTELDAFTCDHCAMMYNTKDAFIGPHTQMKSLTITNSVSIGNMGAQWKWGTSLNATVEFLNNLTVMNCHRMQEILPGAPQNFDAGTGLGGSYLTGYCRGAGNGFSINTRAGSTNTYANNTVIGANATIVYLDCGYYSTGNTLHEESNCGTTANNFVDNVFLGYVDPSNGSGQNPGLWYPNPGSGIVITSSNNDEYGIRNGDTCGLNGILCADPLFVNEPAMAWPGSEAALDVFNPFAQGNSFYPGSGSPLPMAGTTYPAMLATDYYGKLQTAPRSLGALVP